MPSEGSRSRLSDSQISEGLQALPEWTVKDGKLHREYQFPDFAHAFGFMATSAPLIERMNHHPEWSNVYSRVVVDLSTHDAGGITQLDFKLGKLLEGIARKLA
jgi:4a-hydroxytetrahydrobiopterin dehydratase